MNPLHFGHQQDDNNNNSEMKNDYRYSSLNQHQLTKLNVDATGQMYNIKLPFQHEIYSDTCPQMPAHQGTAIFFIFADLCLMKRAASMLLVPTGAFWIARPLGLSKE
jgi:hypothetical protein